MPRQLCQGNRKWTFVGSELVEEDIVTGKRSSTPIGHPHYESLQKLTIRDVEWTPDHDAILVLLDVSHGYRTVGNIACVEICGDIRWWVESLDTGWDSFTEMSVTEKGIIAFAGDGWNCQVDPKDGRIVSKVFVK